MCLGDLTYPNIFCKPSGSKKNYLHKMQDDTIRIIINDGKRGKYDKMMTRGLVGIFVMAIICLFCAVVAAGFSVYEIINFAYKFSNAKAAKAQANADLAALSD